MFQPNSPYSALKAAAEHLVRRFHQSYGLTTTVSHCSNNFGPNQFPQKLIPLRKLNILQNKALPVYGDGLQMRVSIYVTDCVRGIAAVIKEGKAGECYNISANNEYRNIDIGLLVVHLLEEGFASEPAPALRFPDARAAMAGETDTLIRYVQDRAGHERRYAINSSKLRAELALRL